MKIEKITNIYIILKNVTIIIAHFTAHCKKNN